MTFQSYVCFNLVEHRPSFQKNAGFTSNISIQIDENWQRMPKIGEICCFLGDKFLIIPTLSSKYMPCLSNAVLSNDGNVPGITLRVIKMLSAKNHVFVQNIMEISSGQNFQLSVFLVPSFSNKPKLGLKFQLKVQNIDLSIIITHI